VENAEAMPATPVVNLSSLRAKVSPLNPDHPLRILVESLPPTVSLAEFAALTPTMWKLSERA
jgi:hypothetical protein